MNANPLSWLTFFFLFSHKKILSYAFACDLGLKTRPKTSNFYAPLNQASVDRWFIHVCCDSHILIFILLVVNWTSHLVLFVDHLRSGRWMHTFSWRPTSRRGLHGRLCDFYLTVYYFIFQRHYCERNPDDSSFYAFALLEMAFVNASRCHSSGLAAF